MTIHEFELDEDVKDASADELLDTLNEFMQKHEENVEVYRSLEEKATEFEDDVEEKEETIDTLKTYFAEIVAESSPLFTAEEVAERYDAATLMEKAGEASEFTDEVDDEETEETEETTFGNKEQKSRQEPGESGGEELTEFQKLARQDAKQMGYQLE